jgi:hypothetical protein
MDAQLSTTLTIALARALEARPVSAPVGPRAGVPNSFEQTALVASRAVGTVPRDLDDSRRPIVDERPASQESTVNPDAFVSGMLDMVAYGRHQADALVEYPADRDTVL